MPVQMPMARRRRGAQAAAPMKTVMVGAAATGMASRSSAGSSPLNGADAYQTSA